MTLGCQGKVIPLPEKKSILVNEIVNSDNFFPLATLDLANKGLKDKIHVMYVYFDPNTESKLFPKDEYVDNFSFTINEDGLYKPNFDTTALRISDDDMRYFIEGKDKYDTGKPKIDISSLIQFPKDPEWWQNDDTPKNSQGKNMKFICQVDIYEVFNDDCRLFVFYDKMDKTVRYIYQRD